MEHREKSSSKKVKVPKTAIALISTLGIGGTGALVLKKSYETKNDFENQNGRENSWFFQSLLMDEDDFVILDVGDHNTFGVLLQGKKMDYLQEHGISFGIVITSDAKNERDIYDDVEYAKGLVRDYRLEMPVYLNIDSIITNDQLNNEMKTKIIRDFLDKCSANGMYVGISGTDTNLCRVKNNCGITGYDAYLIQDSEIVQYDGVYHLYRDLKGRIHADSNLAEVIHSRSLNTDSRFCADVSYVMKEGEDITDVALQYGMSVSEILSFNGLKRRDLEAGTTIRIPCAIATTGEPKQLEEPIRGCDISYAQGKDSDWEALAENFEFIILKCSEGMSKDDCFDYNSAKCGQYGIPYGVYCFNAYHHNNCDDMEMFEKKQKDQASFVLSLLENKKVEYPVYLDVEFNGDISEYLTPEEVQIMLDNWAKKITEAGYTPAIYCNQSEFRYLQSCVDYNLSDVFKVWIAGGEQYYSDDRDIELEDVHPSYGILESDEFGAEMVQSTSSAINAGAGNGEGHLDIDFSLTDYSQEDYITSTADIKEFNRFLDQDFAMPAGVGTSLVLLASLGIVLGKIKNARKRKVR